MKTLHFLIKDNTITPLDKPKYSEYSECKFSFSGAGWTNCKAVAVFERSRVEYPVAISQNGVGTNTTIKSVTDYSPYDLLIIASGTNDFKLDMPLGNIGNIGDSSFDTNTFFGAYRDSIEYILKKNPSLRICLWTPLQRDNSNYDVNHINSAGYKLVDYCDAILQIGAMYGIPVLDLYRTSGVTKLTLSKYTVDGLHLNGVGYDFVTRYASKFIDSI